MPDTLHFGPVERAVYLDRPNRFLVRCRSQRSRKIIEAYLPNPGRLSELLLPEATIYLAPPQPASGGAGPDRRTRRTVLAVERDENPIFLHTHLTNRAAEFLIRKRRIEELANAELVRAEVPVGRSRMDFLLRNRGRDLYLEVKSCTLYGNGVAMFPDAPTQRGQKHLAELAELRRAGAQSVVLFLVHAPDVRWFMPDYHTDYEFARLMLQLRKQLQVLPIAVQWTRQLELLPDTRRLEIPWRHLEREAKDRGAYLLLLRLKRTQRIEVGRLGKVRFESGHYLYVGSAMRGLAARLARHTRKRKKLHWHIDYLRQHADKVTALPIRSSERDECRIAQSLTALFPTGPDGFGSSDCGCPTHLFWSKHDPLHSAVFHQMLQSYRMKHPTGEGD